MSKLSFKINLNGDLRKITATPESLVADIAERFGLESNPRISFECQGEAVPQGEVIRLAQNMQPGKALLVTVAVHDADAADHEQNPFGFEGEPQVPQVGRPEVGVPPTGSGLCIESCKQLGKTLHTAIDPNNHPENGCGVHLWDKAPGYAGNTWTVEHGTRTGHYTIRSDKCPQRCLHTALDPAGIPQNGCGLHLWDDNAGYHGQEWKILQGSQPHAFRICAGKNHGVCLHTAIPVEHVVDNGTNLHCWGGGEGYVGAEFFIYELNDEKTLLKERAIHAKAVAKATKDEAKRMMQTAKEEARAAKDAEKAARAAEKAALKAQAKAKKNAMKWDAQSFEPQNKSPVCSAWGGQQEWGSQQWDGANAGTWSKHNWQDAKGKWGGGGESWGCTAKFEQQPDRKADNKQQRKQKAKGSAGEDSETAGNKAIRGKLVNWGEGFPATCSVVGELHVLSCSRICFSADLHPGNLRMATDGKGKSSNGQDLTQYKVQKGGGKGPHAQFEAQPLADKPTVFKMLSREYSDRNCFLGVGSARVQDPALVSKNVCGFMAVSSENNASMWSFYPEGSTKALELIAPTPLASASGVYMQLQAIVQEVAATTGIPISIEQVEDENDAAKMLNALLEMLPHSIKRIAMKKIGLRQFEVAIEVPAEWEEQLVDLVEMGFEDRDKNVIALQTTNGDVKKAVKHLVQASRDLM